jgi:hypothetical protein
VQQNANPARDNPAWDEVNREVRSTSRLTVRMTPAEVAFSPSFRITLRQFEEPVTASVNWASDHVRSNVEGRAIPETVAVSTDI